jgi:hypothetical protein
VDTDTQDLVNYREQTTQTKISLVDPKYDALFETQNKFTLWYKRSIFQQQLMGASKAKKQMHIIKDPKMRMMLAGIYKSREDGESLEQLEADPLRMEHRNPEPSSIPDQDGQQPPCGRLGISKELWDSLIPEQQIEELIDSYAFEANKVMDLSQKLFEKEKNFTSLIEITRRLKLKMMINEQNIESLSGTYTKFKQMHRGCNVTKETTDLLKRKYARPKKVKGGAKDWQQIDWKGKAEYSGSDARSKKVEREIKRKLEIEKQSRVSEERIDE